MAREQLHFVDVNGNTRWLHQEINLETDAATIFEMTTAGRTNLYHISSDCRVTNGKKEYVGRMRSVGQDLNTWGLWTSDEYTAEPVWQLKCGYPYAGELDMAKFLINRDLTAAAAEKPVVANEQ